MPNWIEGTLKVRGKRENIEKFIFNAIEANVEEDPYGGFTIETKTYGWFIDTDRMFLKETTEVVFYEYGDGDVIIFLPIQQAWDWNVDDFVRLSSKYYVNLRVYGFERGMEFTHEIEIVKGGMMLINETKKYKDYEWECPCPTLGG